jgi:hypothetical protein
MGFQLIECETGNFVTQKETPSVEVEDRSDYLHSGNVKPDDQALGLPEQL